MDSLTVVTDPTALDSALSGLAADNTAENLDLLRANEVALYDVVERRQTLNSLEDRPPGRKAKNVQFKSSLTKEKRQDAAERALRVKPARAKSIINRSSTMPGFSAPSQKQLAYEENVRFHERKTGKRVVESDEVKEKRKKQNGVYMYANSASVPESMMQFATDIHNEERITRLQEIELGQMTQEAVRLQNHYEVLKAKLQREPTDAEWCAASGKINIEALGQAIEDGLNAKNTLVTSNLRMVQSVVNTYIRNGLGGQYNAGDMMQDGIVALIRAAEKFEPDRGWKFSTYAMYWVRSSVKRSQILQSRRIKVPQRLHESYKRLLKVQKELRTTLDRQPTRAEIAEGADMTVAQMERCVTAMEQRCYSLDQAVVNSAKPMNVNSQQETLLDIVDTSSSFTNAETAEREFLRESLITTLSMHLKPIEVELLLYRYGIKRLPSFRINRQPTFAEIGRVTGIKPDTVRRMIRRSLSRLNSKVSKEEWVSFERDFEASMKLS